MPEVELTGVTVVAAGSFNPAIFHPSWFGRQELLAQSDVEFALTRLAVTPQLTSFDAGWLTVQVTGNQAAFSTIEEGRESDLRNLVLGSFELLPHTPIDAVGLNTDTHFRVASDEAWHEIGDRFLPKKDWAPLFQQGDWTERAGGGVVGLRTMTVEAWKPNRKDYVRVEVGPSVRLTPNGVYIGINSHLQLSIDADDRATGEVALSRLGEEWDSTRSFESELQGGILQWTS